MTKEEKLELVKKSVDKINKDNGERSISLLSDKPLTKEDIIKTGSIGLDIALGIGGLPKGRIVEIYGPESSGKTTIATHIIAEAQKAGGIAAFIDVEHAFDRQYAENLGVDVNELLISQPDYGEQALNIACDLCEGGGVDVIVIDSVAALVPKKELEGDVGDSTIGLQARLMGQALRMLTGYASKNNTLVIFINQLREKIGVMFGCLHADMPILFTDGRSIPIKKVVDERIEGNILCFNETTNQIEEKPIIDWHFNGNFVNKEDYIHIDTTSIDGGGKFGVTVTPNHKLLSEDGWKEAKDITIQEKLLSKYESILVDKNTEDFLNGCLVGDSHISIRNMNTASLHFQDSLNEEYSNWKKDILSKCIAFKQNGKRWESEYTYEFAKIKKEIENRNPLKIFKDGIISDLSLAIWIMDDGHYKHSHKNYLLSIKRFKNNKEILKKIKELFIKNGLNCNYGKEGNFLFTVESSKIIADRIAPYIFSSMEYKLPLNLINCDKINLNIKGGKIVKTDYVTVLSKRVASNRQMRQKGKYDISVQDNHNYFSGGYKNGILVHNSPETTSGGNALKFYASVRLDIRRSTSADNIIKTKDGETLGNLIKVKVIKNKVAPPFTNCEFDVLYGIGIDKIGEIITLGSKKEVLKKWGKTITVLKTNEKFDLEEFRQILLDNDEFREEIIKQIYEA